MKPSYSFLIACVMAHLFAGVAGASPQTSTNYSILMDSFDAGGGKTTSGDYANDGSLGAIGDVTTAGVYVSRAGFPGQLYGWTDVLAVEVAPATLGEGVERPLSVKVVADDETLVQLQPADVVWTKSGPLSIDSVGMATGGTVYQDTAATATATLGTATGQLSLTVLDTIPDNFGSYAGDGITDGWQFEYFGADNPNAEPSLDPDGDGHDNEFEFIAGLSPVNPLSRFLVSIVPVSSQPSQQQIIFEPRYPSRNYRILTSENLAPGSWTLLSTGSTSDDGVQRTVTDANAEETKKFYKVEIQRP